MKIYLDTSVLNDIASDKHGELVIERLVHLHQPMFSILNIIEILSTPQPSRRLQLYDVLTTLSKECLPDIENVFIAFLDAYVQNETKALVTLVKYNSMLTRTNVLQRTSLPGAILEWKDEREKSWILMHSRARNGIQRFIQGLSSADKRTLQHTSASYLHYLLTRHELISDYSGYVLDTLNRRDRCKGLELEVSNLEPWRFYLVSLVLASYNYAIKNSNYSPTRNPGSIDTVQAVYLACTDAFVTSDRSHHRMLRMTTRLGHVFRPIWSYKDLKSQLGL